MDHLALAQPLNQFKPGKQLVARFHISKKRADKLYRAQGLWIAWMYKSTKGLNLI